MDAGDWRSQLQPESRLRIVNKILETLKRHLPFSGQDGLIELKNIAVRFEEKIYSAATSQNDYLRKISLKLLTMETKSQNPTVATNPASSRIPMEPVPQNLQPQVRQQMLAQNVPVNIASGGIQSSAGLASTLPPVSGVNQSPVSNVINQTSNMQNIQKQVPGRQQVAPGQQQSQQQRYMYQQQLQQQLIKQKQLQQGNIPNSLMQSHIQPQQQQQQNLLQPNQMQSSQQQQALMGQQTNTTSMQPSQLLGQQNMSDMPQQQQQRLMTQQNNLMNMPQQQLHMVHQGLLQGTQSSNSCIKSNQHQTHMLHQNKGPVPPQNQQPASNLLANQGQHSQPAQPQMLSQIQSQSAQLQEHLGMNQQQRDTQQRLQPSGAPMQPHNISNQQKQMYQSQRALLEASSTSVDPASQTGHANSADGQDEVFKKITGMKERYLPDITELYQRISLRLQQPKTDQLEKLKMYKTMLERIIAFLRVNKSNVNPAHGEKLASYENQIIKILSTNKPSRPPGQLPPHMQSIQQQSQNLQAQSHVNHVNAPLQSANIPSQQGVSRVLQQNSANGPQQTNMNPMSSQNGVNLLQPKISNLPSNGGVNQQLVKEQQILQSQQITHQFQQRLMQQQRMQKQQLLQQQPLRQQNKQQQPLPGQMSAHQLPQFHAAGQRSIYQQVKPGVPVPVSSPQMLQTSSPQHLQNYPQVDQQSMLSPLLKTGNPLQSASSPSVVPSPSTPSAPSPMPGDSEKANSNVSSLTADGNTRNQQSAASPAPTQPLAIGTPGISASPLLAEFDIQDASHGVTSAEVAKSSVTDQPLDRLIKAVKSISKEALAASVSDIESVVSMIDRIAASAPGNGSREAVGEDLVAVTNCRLQAKNFATQGGCNGSMKLKRLASATPLLVVSTTGSVNNAEFSDLESTATSRAKRPRLQVNLLEEIREINQQLIDTMVDISDEGVDPSVAAAAASEDGEGVIVKCSYNAVALSPNFKARYASGQMSPIQPLRLLVPSNYPNCSPVLLDKLPVDVSNETEDLSIKAKSKFSTSLRTLSQPVSLGEIARTWDFCARAVISEYAQASGGGSFSSRYGRWESILST